jgi:hypothetical protein
MQSKQTTNSMQEKLRQALLLTAVYTNSLNFTTDTIIIAKHYGQAKQI